jgi:hypothetical protein
MTLNIRRGSYRANLNNRARYTHCVIAPRCPAMFLPIGIRKTSTSQSLPASSVLDSGRIFNRRAASARAWLLCADPSSPAPLRPLRSRDYRPCARCWTIDYQLRRKVINRLPIIGKRFTFPSQETEMLHRCNKPSRLETNRNATNHKHRFEPTRRLQSAGKL